MMHFMVVDLCSSGVDFVKNVINSDLKPIIVVPEKDKQQCSIPEEIIKNSEIIEIRSDFESDEAAYEVTKKLKEIPYEKITGIFPGDEFGVLLTSKLGKALNINSNSIKAGEILRNKFLQREILKENGFLTPLYFSLKTTDELKKIADKLKFPVVLKPNDGVGKFGVNKIYDKKQLFSCFETESKNLKNKVLHYNFNNKWLVEEFIEGRKYSVEIIVVSENEVVPFVITETTMVGDNFIEVGHALPSEADENFQKIINETSIQCVKRSEITHGVIHLELIANKNNEIYIIELNGRFPGGKVPNMIEKASGNNYFKMALDAILHINTPDVKLFNKSIAIHWFCKKTGAVAEISGFDDVNNFPGYIEKDISIKPGDKLEESFDGYDRIGYSMNFAENLQQAKINAKTAADSITIHYK